MRDPLDVAEEMDSNPELARLRAQYEAGTIDAEDYEKAVDLTLTEALHEDEPTTTAQLQRWIDADFDREAERLEAERNEKQQHTRR